MCLRDKKIERNKKKWRNQKKKRLKHLEGAEAWFFGLL